ncbi:hypothetical protein [Paraburkholderia sp. BL25I1N1]|uniref:hypothetical protein n=1 Tax=Paraburkholderia sp. BL25I1N1 TaxID=1938804 RepID=UPI0015E60945|nr:hypothetical protein [Paraburkholderia sp. BL25I1N1]
MKTLERIAQVYDDQIGGISSKTFAECNARLERLVRVRIPQKNAAIETASLTLPDVV